MSDLPSGRPAVRERPAAFVLNTLGPVEAAPVPATLAPAPPPAGPSTTISRRWSAVRRSLAARWTVCRITS